MTARGRVGPALALTDEQMRRHTAEIIAFGIAYAMRRREFRDPRGAEALALLIKDGPVRVARVASARGSAARVPGSSLVTISEALDGVEGVTERTVRTWARDGLIRAEKSGRDWRVNRSDVLRRIEKRTA